MFKGIRHTIDLMKMSWRVLMLDRELILFPIFSGVAIIALMSVLFGVGAASGTLDRIGSEGPYTVSDAALAMGFTFTASAIVIFFNAALVAAALERLRGGDPTVKSGLIAALAHLPQILAWALISVVVAMVLQALRERGGIAGRLASMIGGVAWSLATFFVIPVLVSEGLGPIAAIKRSGGLLRDTWGSQVTANFGFTLIGVVAVLAVILPAGLIFAVVHPVVGLALGVPGVVLVVAALQALQAIFKAALYDYANGDDPHGFDRDTLEAAYRAT